MRDVLAIVIPVAAVLFPFIAMPLLWRRMKRVRAQTYHATDPQPKASGWEETVEDADGLRLSRAHRPNDDLIALGDKARHARWPLSNE